MERRKIGSLEVSVVGLGCNNFGWRIGPEESAEVVKAAPPEARGFHQTGFADPSGFAAMGCDEVLIHTDDIARAFGLFFTPPDELCRRVLRRLFPWAPEDGDGWSVLRWANGRMALPGRERLGEDWPWHSAPLSEWDGSMPTA